MFAALKWLAIPLALVAAYQMGWFHRDTYWRTWTSNDGVSIKARIYALRINSIVLIKKDELDDAGEHKRFDVPINRLCLDDQAYVERVRAYLKGQEANFKSLQDSFPGMDFGLTEEANGGVSYDLYHRFKRFVLYSDVYSLPERADELKKRVHKEIRHFDKDVVTQGGIGDIAAQRQVDEAWLNEILLPYMAELQNFAIAIDPNQVK